MAPVRTLLTVVQQGRVWAALRFGSSTSFSAFFTLALTLLIRAAVQLAGQPEAVESPEIIRWNSGGDPVEIRWNSGGESGGSPVEIEKKRKRIRKTLVNVALKTRITSDDVEMVSGETMTETMTFERKSRRPDITHRDVEPRVAPPGLEPGLS